MEVKDIVNQYDIGRSIVKDIQAAKENLRAFSLTIELGSAKAKDSALMKTTIEKPSLKPLISCYKRGTSNKGLTECQSKV